MKYGNRKELTKKLKSNFAVISAMHGVNLNFCSLVSFPNKKIVFQKFVKKIGIVTQIKQYLFVLKIIVGFFVYFVITNYNSR